MFNICGHSHGNVVGSEVPTTLNPSSHSSEFQDQFSTSSASLHPLVEDLTSSRVDTDYSLVHFRSPLGCPPLALSCYMLGHIESISTEGMAYSKPFPGVLARHMFNSIGLGLVMIFTETFASCSVWADCESRSRNQQSVLDSVQPRGHLGLGHWENLEMRNTQRRCPFSI